MEDSRTDSEYGENGGAASEYGEFAPIPFMPVKVNGNYYMVRCKRKFYFAHRMPTPETARAGIDYFREDINNDNLIKINKEE